MSLVFIVSSYNKKHSLWSYVEYVYLFREAAKKLCFFSGPTTKAQTPPSHEQSGHPTFSDFVFEFQEMFFFLSGPAFTTLPQPS